MKGSYEATIPAFSRAIGFEKTRARAYPGRGRCYQFGGRYDESIVDFNEAIRLDPQNNQGCREWISQADAAKR